jgi:hypothetical protein
MPEPAHRPWRRAFAWATVWVAAASVTTLAYTYEWLGRPAAYALWTILGLLLFVANVALPLIAGLVHRSWRVGLAVAAVGAAVLAAALVVGLIGFGGAAGGFH